MTDIFISYSQKDRERVKRLVDALTAEGYKVWWDLNIRAGESFDERIESMLEKVSCVVGVWSNTSVNSEWVRAESGWAKDRDIFVSVRIDNDVPLPLKFYYVHATNLAGWNGSRDAAEFRSVLKDVQVLAGPPTPATRPLSWLGNPASTDIASPPRPFQALSNFRDPLRDGGKGPEMVVIPAGTFSMGSELDDGGGDFSERPSHQVEIPTPFAMGKTPVTFSDYVRFAKATSETVFNRRPFAFFFGETNCTSRENAPAVAKPGSASR